MLRPAPAPGCSGMVTHTPQEIPPVPGALPHSSFDGEAYPMDSVCAATKRRVALGLIYAAVSGDQIEDDRKLLAEAAEILGYALHPEICELHPPFTVVPETMIDDAARAAKAPAVIVPDLSHLERLGGFTLNTVSLKRIVFIARGPRPEPYRGPAGTTLDMNGVES